MLMSFVVGVAGMELGNRLNVNKDKGPIVRLVVEEPVNYTFEPNTLAIEKGGSEINFEYRPDNNVRAVGTAYEYAFKNPMNDKMAVSLKTIDTTDVNVSYHYSTTKLNKDSVTASTSILPLREIESNATEYVYIIVTPKNASIPVSFTTSVVWWQGMAGAIAWNVNGQTVTQNIVKGQILNPPTVEVQDGYEVEYYTDAEHTKVIDITTYRASAGMIYIGFKENGLNSDWFELSSDGTYYTLVRGSDDFSQLPTNLVIPATYNNLPVKEIGEYAMGGAYGGGRSPSNTFLTSVTIPASITKIGNYAFDGCTSLQTVTFAPNSQLTRLDGYWSFGGCSSLSSMVIPASVNWICGSTFGGSNISGVTFEDTSLAWVAMDGSGGTLGIYQGNDAINSYLQESPSIHMQVLERVTLDGNEWFKYEDGAYSVFYSGSDSPTTYSGKFIKIPSTYNDGTHGDAPVTAIKYGNTTFFNCSIGELYIPASVTYIEGEMLHYANGGPMNGYGLKFEDEDAVWNGVYSSSSFMISSSDLANADFYDGIVDYSSYYNYYCYNYTKLAEQELPSDWFEYNGTLNVYTVAKPSESVTLDCNIVTIPATYSKDGNPECPVSSIASGTFSGITGLMGIKFEDDDEWVVSAYANDVYVKGGTEVDATNSANNVTMLTSTYASYTWYNYGSNLDSSWLAWDENTESYYVTTGNSIANYQDVIIPYKYNDGTHGEAEVTRIADSAFMGLTLGRVVLPFTLDKIGSSAFYGATWDTTYNVYVPKRVAYIGRNAFNVESGTSYVPLLEKNTTWYYHPDLENWEKKLNGAQLSDPSNWVYTYIDMYGAGYYWYNDEATVLDDTWFAWDSNTSSYYIKVNGSWDSSYYDFTYNKTVKGELVIPRTWDDGVHGKATVTRIDGYAGGPTYYGVFEGMDITKVTILDGVTNIGDEAFAHCKKLMQITLPSTLTEIGSEYPTYDHAFTGCTSLALVVNQSSLDIVAGSTSHGYVAYYAVVVTTSLSEAMIINVEEIAIDGVKYTAITYNDGRPAEYNKYVAQGLVDSNTTSVTLINGTTSIAPNAFSNCTKLASITIPASVTNIGSDAFSSCYALAEVYNLSNLSLTIGSADYGYVAQNARVIHTSASIPSRIKTLNNIVYYTSDADVIALCPAVDGLTSVTFDATTTEINKYAFHNYGSSLTSVTIPEGVHTIGTYSFNRYYSTSFSVPDSLRYVGAGAFSPSYLSSYNTYDNARYLGNSNNPYVILFDTSSTSITSCTIHSSTRIIYSEAFQYCNNLTAITIPASVRQIGANAFYMNASNSFSSVVVASGSELERIETRAFDRTKITSITIPASVTYIGSNAFNRTSLTSATFTNTTGWKRYGKYSSIDSATSVDVTNTSTNANNLKNGSYIYICESAGGSTTPTANLPDAWINSGSGAFYSVVDGTANGGSASDLPDNLVIPSLSSTGVAVDGIDAYAFAPNDVPVKTFSSVYIPSSITYIGYRAFSGQSCTITMEDTTSQWVTNDGTICSASEVASYITHPSGSSMPYTFFTKAVSGTNGNLPTSWLSLSSDQTYYSVVYGTVNPGVSAGELPKYLVIPSQYNNIPVTKISSCAFTYTGSDTYAVMTFSSIFIPSSIIEIGSGSFYNQSCAITMGDSTTEWFGNFGDGQDTIFSASTLTGYIKSHPNGIPCSTFYKIVPGQIPAGGSVLSSDGWFRYNSSTQTYSIVANITIASDYSGYTVNETLSGHVVVPSEYYYQGNFYPVTRIEGATSVPPSGTYGAFSNDAITAVTIPASITSFGDSVFTATGVWGKNLKYIFFEDPYGWTRGGWAVSSDILADPVRALNYIKSGGGSYEWAKSTSTVVKNITFENVSATDNYGFSLNSSGYYESQNAGVNSSYSLAKVTFSAKAGNTLTFDVISYGENNYDFGIFSNLNTTLSSSNSEDSSGVYKSFKGLSSASVQTVTYNITTSGTYYIYIKYRKDGSANSNNDSLQFKLNTSES